MKTKHCGVGFSEELLLAAMENGWILCGLEASKARSVEELLERLDGAYAQALRASEEELEHYKGLAEFRARVADLADQLRANNRELSKALQDMLSVYREGETAVVTEERLDVWRYILKDYGAEVFQR